jgi:hypothetical protein
MKLPVSHHEERLGKRFRRTLARAGMSSMTLILGVVILGEFNLGEATEIRTHLPSLIKVQDSHASPAQPELTPGDFSRPGDFGRPESLPDARAPGTLVAPDKKLDEGERKETAKPSAGDLGTSSGGFGAPTTAPQDDLGTTAPGVSPGDFGAPEAPAPPPPD